MTVTLKLSPEVARGLAEKAAQSGQTLEAYLEQLAETDSRATSDSRAWSPELSSEDFDHLLEDLAAGPTLPHLPANFSRADVYKDHD